MAVRPDLSGLSTFADVDATRRAKPKGMEPSRLQVKVAKQRDEAKDERVWRAAIWKRDRGQCRWCRRVVRQCLELCPERGECHHVSGRVVAGIRWDVRNGLLLCAACHERVTGKVAEKHLIASKHTFTVDEIAYINADKPVKFTRIA